MQPASLADCLMEPLYVLQGQLRMLQTTHQQAVVNMMTKGYAPQNFNTSLGITFVLTEVQRPLPHKRFNHEIPQLPLISTTRHYIEQIPSL